MFLLSIALLAAAPQSVDAPQKAAPAIGTEASVPFIHRAKLRHFEPDHSRDDAVYIQDQRRNWYHAKLSFPCPALDLALAIGVDTKGTNKLDRDSELLVRGDRCRLTSLTHSDAPPPKPKKAKKAKA